MMSRFRLKRAKDDLAAPRRSEESETTRNFLRKKDKKHQEEIPKKEFDLANALPSDDNFRTSLLMPSLSARFSMLREQDDPNTKIGKASDDSVLFPKRQSRLADFGFGGGASTGLSDIAEVESIRASSQAARDSTVSDDATNYTGSILNRGRPGEGNVLFGGRQKIYKIPAGSTSGLGGRALYEDDVSLSAFQRWRREERERLYAEQNGLNNTSSTDDAEEETEQSRSESPVSYNRKRETSTTTSSGSAARNSTAASSITSQPASTAPTTAVSTPAGERVVTRTRKLYETVNQDSTEPAPGLSRLESLTRQRPFARDASNSETADQSKPTGIKVQTDKSNVGSLPPLSPPISESGEHSLPSLLSKDAKVTATSLFQKSSAQTYDESQYVQRLQMLQQTKESSTQRQRTESNATTSSRPAESKSGITSPRPSLQQERLPPTPVAEIESTPSTGLSLNGLAMLPELQLERPSDKDHPAFRQPSLPTPSTASTNGKALSPALKPTISVEASKDPEPIDSPTLGPASGLSGLVLRHLRSESVESAVTGFSADLDSRLNLSSNLPSSLTSNTATASSNDSRSNAWSSAGSSREKEWTASYYSVGSDSSGEKRLGETQRKSDVVSSDLPDRSGNNIVTDEEQDEFATQLADARRRVREKLTSYVESDSSRAASPMPGSDSPNLAPQPSSNPLGILKPKSSRGSLIDRGRNMVTGPSKPFKILGIGGTTSNPPSSNKLGEEFPPLETMKEETVKEDAVHESESESKEDDANTHPGLRAFRQARRELQKRKELEMLARHQISQTQGGVNGEQGSKQRTPSRERRPPPVSYRGPTDEYGCNGSRTSGERGRSGSETSEGRSSSRPPLFSPDYRRSPADAKTSPMMPSHPFTRTGPSPVTSPLLERQRSNNNLHNAYGNGVPLSPAGTRSRQTSASAGQSPALGSGTFPAPVGKPPQYPPPQPPQQSGGYENGGTRSRSNSRSGSGAPQVPPPVPPINPRRRTEVSKTRPPFEVPGGMI